MCVWYSKPLSSRLQVFDNNRSCANQINDSHTRAHFEGGNKQVFSPAHDLVNSNGVWQCYKTHCSERTPSSPRRYAMRYVVCTDYTRHTRYTNSRAWNMHTNRWLCYMQCTLNDSAIYLYRTYDSERFSVGARPALWFDNRCRRFCALCLIELCQIPMTFCDRLFVFVEDGTVRWRRWSGTGDLSYAIVMRSERGSAFFKRNSSRAYIAVVQSCTQTVFDIVTFTFDMKMHTNTWHAIRMQVQSDCGKSCPLDYRWIMHHIVEFAYFGTSPLNSVSFRFYKQDIIKSVVKSNNCFQFTLFLHFQGMRISVL